MSLQRWQDLQQGMNCQTFKCSRGQENHRRFLKKAEWTCTLMRKGKKGLKQNLKLENFKFQGPPGGTGIKIPLQGSGVQFLPVELRSQGVGKTKFKCHPLRTSSLARQTIHLIPASPQGEGRTLPWFHDSSYQKWCADHLQRLRKAGHGSTL